MNYGLQILQLGVMLMQLNDTELEGDGDRSLINWKMLMLFFRCRSKSMKYGYEAMRFITCVKALYSEKDARRVLHGQFVNTKGGPGNNCANDLKMEHIVRQNKTILKGLWLTKHTKRLRGAQKQHLELEKSSINLIWKQTFILNQQATLTRAILKM